MPPTSAVSLLPPQPIVSPPAVNYPPSTSDTSFQQTLDDAHQRQSAAADDSATAQSQPGQDQKVAKKTAKPIKPKKTVAKKATDESDDSTEAETSTADKVPPMASEPAEITDDPQPGVPTKKPVSVETKKPQTDQNTPISTGNAANPSQEAAKTPTDTSKKTSDGLIARKPTVVKSTDGKKVKDKSPDDATAKPSDADNASDPNAVAAAVVNPTAAPAVKSVGFGDAKVTSPNGEQDNDQPAAAAHVQTVPKSDAAADDAAPVAQPADALAAVEPATAEPHETGAPAEAPMLANFEQQLQRALTPTAAKADTPPPTPTAQPQFAEANHPSIVTGVQSQLLPNGGSMQIQLNPAELGALQVTVQMRDGVMSASFETSNDQASRMLSHSLNQLKTSLESTGITVEKMHVQQVPKQDAQSKSDDSPQQKQFNSEQQQQARQDQQRKQMLQKMWSKLSGIEDPLDLVA